MAKTVFCPNAGCSQHSNPDPSLFIKKGKAPGYKQKTYQRYLCKVCDTKFSARKLQWHQTFKDTKILYQIQSIYTGGTSIQRATEDLDLDKKTTLKVLEFVGKKIEIYHRHLLQTKQLKSNNIAFDEMESYIHGKHYPVAIGLAIDGNTSKILGLGLATTKVKGPLKKKVLWKHKTGKITLPDEFFTRKDTSRQMCKDLLISLKPCLRKGNHITTDDDRGYISLIRDNLVGIKHNRIKSKAPKPKPKPGKRTYKMKPLAPVAKKQQLAMARLNSMAGTLRRNCSRLGRRTQITTKREDMLLWALYMNLAYINDYDLKTVLSFTPPKEKPVRKKK